MGKPFPEIKITFKEKIKKKKVQHESDVLQRKKGG